MQPRGSTRPSVSKSSCTIAHHPTENGEAEPQSIERKRIHSLGTSNGLILPRCDTHADLFGVDLDTNIGLARLHAVPFAVANEAPARQHAAVSLEIVLHHRPP